jgi:hypothetical protein
MATAEPIYSLRGKRVYVAGRRGMVGAALLRRLQREDCRLLTAGREELSAGSPSEFGSSHFLWLLHPVASHH